MNKADEIIPVEDNGSVTVKNMRTPEAPMLRAACSIEGFMLSIVWRQIKYAIGKKHSTCAITSPGNPYSDMSRCKSVCVIKPRRPASQTAAHRPQLPAALQDG